MAATQRPNRGTDVLALQRALLAGEHAAPMSVTGPVAYRFGDEPGDVASVMLMSGPNGGGMIETTTYEAIERFRARFAAGTRPSVR